MTRWPGFLTCIVLFVLAAWPLRAQAITNCSATATNLVFTEVTGDQHVDVTAEVTLQCNTTLSLAGPIHVRACLSIGYGTGSPDQIHPWRRMTRGGPGTLDFQLYRNPGRTDVWGSRVLDGGHVPVDLQYQLGPFGIGSGSTSRTIYARIPTQSGLQAGSFSSSFAATHTLLEYRYRGSAGYPTSCLEGGVGGSSNDRFGFQASAIVPAHCALSASDLDFGSVPGLIDQHRDQTSVISLTCTGGTAWNVALDDGQNASGNVRRMRRTDGGGHVAYDVYIDAARTRRWGSTAGVDTQQGTGTGHQQTATVYGRVPSGQSVPAGSYSDTITVTVTY